MLICDTRERKNAHILAYFDRHKIEYKVKKLDVGDYMLDGGNLSIDRKQNLSELMRNLFDRQDKRRFFAELQRARDNGIQLVILCEHGGGIKTLADVARWKSKYSRVSGRALADALTRIEYVYRVKTVFCDKRSTARIIIEILQNNIDNTKTI